MSIKFFCPHFCYFSFILLALFAQNAKLNLWPRYILSRSFDPVCVGDEGTKFKCLKEMYLFLPPWFYPLASFKTLDRYHYYTPLYNQNKPMETTKTLLCGESSAPETSEGHHQHISSQVKSIFENIFVCTFSNVK